LNVFFQNLSLIEKPQKELWTCAHTTNCWNLSCRGS